MFGNIKKFVYRSKDKETIGRRLKIQERLKFGTCPLYQIYVLDNKNIVSKANFSQVEVICLCLLWEDSKHTEFQNLKKKIVKRPTGFSIYHLRDTSWVKQVDVELSNEELKYFLETVKTLLSLQNES